MKNVIVAGVAALALVGCGAKEDVVVVEETPVVEAAAEAPAAEVVAEEVVPTEVAE
jgi:uncharacterized protein YcfL